VAEANYKQALQAKAAHEYKLYILEEQVKLAELALQELKEGVDPLLSKEVERANLVVERLRAQLADGRIFAPFSGRVMSVGAYAGKYADAFKSIIILADLTELEISAELGGDQLRDLSVGQPARIVLVDYPDQELTGEVRRLPYPFGEVEAFEEEDRSVRISFDPKGIELETGALAKVTIEIERKEDVLYLPPAAIRTFGGRKFVVVKDGEVQRRVDVKLGIEGEDRVEIVEGLEEGQVVLGQ
jgi:multidrug efflux pump subunit AcrA (membrane-fusion protein)